MIIIKLKGGLGNQLFQYAFARSLAYNLNKELFLDISYFSHDEHRKHVIYGLNSYKIKGIVGYYPYSEETSIGIDYLSNSRVTEYHEGVKENFPEDIFDYDIIKNIENIKIPAYFDGYFQQQIKNDEKNYITENFFKINNDIIHEDLVYTLPLNQSYNNIINEMKKFDSIALHVRHGDYMDLPEFGLCTKQYYQEAIEYIVSKVENPKFFIFTEDHEWVKNNLKIDFPVEHIVFNEKINASGRGYAELLKVMSLCDHFIIANSTYSWWASFLSENKNKIIIGPKPWFQDRSFIELDTIDNVKIKNISNNYNTLFSESSVKLYDLNENNISTKEMNLKIDKDGKLKCNDLTINSKLILSNIHAKNDKNKAIINIKFDSESLNCLKIYYKTLEKDYCDENSISLYYYKNENINHSLIIPKEAILDELIIKPYTLSHDGKNSITISSIQVKEIIDITTVDKKDLYLENQDLKAKVYKISRKYANKIKEHENNLLNKTNELAEKTKLNNELQDQLEHNNVELAEKTKLNNELQDQLQQIENKNNIINELELENKKLKTMVSDKNNEIILLKEDIINKLESKKTS